MCDVVGQFVLVVWLTREMSGQQGAGLFHSVDNSVRKFGFAEMFGHGIAHLQPEYLTTLLMDGGVANDGKFMNARRHENENAVTCLRFFHAQAHESRLCSGNGVVHLFAADVDADFAGGLAFGFTNRRDDVIMAKLIQELFRVHITSFLRLLRLRSFPRLRRTPHLLQKNLHRRRRPIRHPSLLRTTRRWNKTNRADGAEP